jgi:CRISPR/Cas system-associated exonuclease Cas4 (RecB family)
MTKVTTKLVPSQELGTEIDTPEGIVNFLQKRNGMPYKVAKNRYSVTDLVGCQRKAFYKELGVDQEELLEDATIEKMWGTVRGDFLHQMTYAYKWRELDIEHYVPLKDKRIASVVGRLDMYDWKTRTIIDLKTTKLVKWQIKQGFLPRAEHILQLQCYGTMFSGIMPVENLNIVYVDMNDIVTYKVQLRDLTDWIKTRVTEIEEALSNKTIPTGQVSGLCQFCRYQTRCFSDGNGLQEKPLSVPTKQEEES